MSKSDPTMAKGNRSSMKELSPDHPIYKRGFAVGVTRSMPSSKSTQETTSPSSSEPPSSNPAPPKIRKGGGFSIPWAKADDPIYKRGFAIGVVRSIPSSKSTPAPTSPSSSEPQAPPSNPPQQNEEEDSTPTV